MHKNPFIILLYLFCVLLHPLNATELSLSPIGEDLVRARALWLRNHTLLFLDDHQIVYLLTPPYEKQTWTEWMNGMDHVQPDPRFFFQIQNWKSASLFHLYTYKWEQGQCSYTHPLEDLFEKKPELFEFPYFIENVETGEMTLCQIWDIDQLGSFLHRYGEECYMRGYDAGYAWANARSN